MDLVALVAGICGCRSFQIIRVNDMGESRAIRIHWLAFRGFAGRRRYQNYRDHWITLASIVLLSSSEIFLLHARQCRYYSLSVLAQIVFIYAIYQLLAGNRKGVGILALALILQFYSNYIIVLANLPVMFPVAWHFTDNKNDLRFSWLRP